MIIYLSIHFIMVIVFYIAIYDKNNPIGIIEFLTNLIVGPYLLMWYLYLIFTNKKDFYD